MSLFDQQPFGPIPARKPVRYLPDPELEAAGIDPATAQIEVVDPPAELAAPVVVQHRHPARTLVAWLLLIPFALSVIPSAIFMVGQPDDPMTVPYLVSGTVVLLVVAVAYLIFRRSSPSQTKSAP